MLEVVQIEERIKATVAEFVADWGLNAAIRRETKLVEDLEFDSIDVIQLVIEIEKSFGSRNLGFQELLMQDGRYVEDLSVGDISDYLQVRMGRAMAS